VLTTVTICGIGLLSLFILDNQSRILKQQTDTYAASLGNHLSAAAVEPLLASDLQTIRQLTFNLAENEGILGVAIYADQLAPLSTVGTTPNDDPAQLLQQSPLQWQKKIAEQKVHLISYTNSIRFRDLIVGYYSITYDYSYINMAHENTIWAISAITLLMVALGILTALFISKRLSRPINEIVDGCQLIARGDHTFRFEEGRTDELGQLMDSLNDMTEGLLRKEQVEKTFSKYVSPNVAGSLMNDLEEVHLGGNHVEASVLFADIAGFTSLSENLEPVTVNTLLNDYFTLIDQLADKYGGHIDKYIGDCAMLLFGAPREDKEHALNAVKCAMEIQHRLLEFNQKRQQLDLLTVEFCIGINSGTMLAGNMGSEKRMEYTVVGNAVNLASRLSSLATARQILVTKTVHDSLDLESLFHTSFSRTTQLRGTTDPVEVWQVDAYRQIPEPPEVKSSPSLPSPTVH
jgi:adenylate cyclase